MVSKKKEQAIKLFNEGKTIKEIKEQVSLTKARLYEIKKELGLNKKAQP